MIAAASASAPNRHKRENFPVASRLVAPRHRAAILAFYRFARAADDVVDNPRLPADEKHRRIAAMRHAVITGDSGLAVAECVAALHDDLGIDRSHAIDLLSAFAQDIEVSRYATWDDLLDYCRLSAMPVGRFVLDLHGEDRRLWPLSDALCAALQIINHLQDCSADFHKLDRAYVPTAWLAKAGADVADLGQPRATPGLAQVLAAMARRTQDLLDVARPLAARVLDRRLGREIAVIHRLAVHLAGRLEVEDPLARRVTASRFTAAALAARAVLGHRRERS